MNVTSDPITEATILQMPASTILSAMFYRAIVDSIVWLVIGLALIVADLYFGIEASHRRKEEVRLSRACRRTINKMCEYLCWVMLATTLSIGFEVDWLKYTIFAVVYGIELSSCFSNYFAAHGKRLKFDILGFIGKRIGVEELSDNIVEDDKKQEKNED